MFNMPGAGMATIGEAGTGGSIWEASASLGLSIWVTTVPAAPAPAPAPAPAVPVAPPLPPAAVPAAPPTDASSTNTGNGSGSAAVPPEQHPAAAIYKQYADATGHAPPLRHDAMLFWQSRNRYKSSAIALAVADRYKQLELPVGVLVIDYENQQVDGDFDPFKGCVAVPRACCHCAASVLLLYVSDEFTCFASNLFGR